MKSELPTNSNKTWIGLTIFENEEDLKFQGRWIIMCPTLEVDRLWLNSIDATIKGELGDVHYLRVKTLDEFNNRKSVPLELYCGPIFNETKVKAIGRLIIRHINPKVKYIYYKPDFNVYEGEFNYKLNVNKINWSNSLNKITNYF